MRSLKRTLVLKVNPNNPNKESIFLSAVVLRHGGLVAFPTETVYGLAANLLDKKAIDNLYKIKKRPKYKPFTVHISDTGMIKRLGCRITRDARILINRFWPGPLTVILKSRNNKKIGFRIPDNKIALALIKSSRVPVVAPSANISGDAPPKNSREVLKGLNGKIDILLDGGPTKIGVESTVVDLTSRPPKILRAGAIKKSVIESLIYG